MVLWTSLSIVNFRNSINMSNGDRAKLIIILEKPIYSYKRYTIKPFSICLMRNWINIAPIIRSVHTMLFRWSALPMELLLQSLDFLFRDRWQYRWGFWESRIEDIKKCVKSLRNSVAGWIEEEHCLVWDSCFHVGLSKQPSRASSGAQLRKIIEVHPLGYS